MLRSPGRALLGNAAHTPACNRDFKLEVENAKAHGSWGAIIMNGVTAVALLACCFLTLDRNGYADMSQLEVKYQCQCCAKCCLGIGEDRGRDRGVTKGRGQRAAAFPQLQPRVPVGVRAPHRQERVLSDPAPPPTHSAYLH